MEDFSGAEACFVPGTLVLLANNKSIPIEKVRAGDQIVCRNNSTILDWHRSIGTASDEQVVTNTNSHPFRVYGFNDQQPFFTAATVFFTTTGLRALDPHAAHAQNPWLEVGLLQSNDVVKRATESGYELERIQHLTHEDWKTGTAVYGVHLREGLRSYHANGYLVYLNYPELTKERLLTGLQHLPILQRLHFIQDFQKVEKSLESVVGHFLPSAVKHIASSTTAVLSKAAYNPASPAPPGLKHRALHHVAATFNLKPQLGSASDTLEMPHEDAPVHVSLARGRVFINGNLVTAARLTRDQVHWTRPVRNPAQPGGKEMFEHGAIHLYPHRRAGYGSLVITSCPSPSVPSPVLEAPAMASPVLEAPAMASPVLEATAMASPVPAETTKATTITLEEVPASINTVMAVTDTAASPPPKRTADPNSCVTFAVVADCCRYKTQVSTQPAADVAAPPPPDVKWIPGPGFLLGGGEENCYAEINTADGQLVGMSTIFKTQGSNMSIDMKVHPEELQAADSKLPHQYSRLKARLSDQTSAFTGYVSKFDPNAPDFEGQLYHWQGQYISEENDAPGANLQIDSPDPHALGASLADMHESHLVTSEPHPVTLTLAQDTSGRMTETQVLRALAEMPEIERYQELGLQLLHGAMLYHLDEAEWDKFFSSQAKPDTKDLQLGQMDLVNITSEQRDFLVNKYAEMYKPRTMNPISGEDWLQDAHFFSGAVVPDSIAADSSYNELRRVANALAFAKLAGDGPLKDCINDPGGEWSWKFFCYLTSHRQDANSGPATHIHSLPKLNHPHSLLNSATLQQLCQALTCLQRPGEDLDAKLWAMVASEGGPVISRADHIRNPFSGV